MNKLIYGLFVTMLGMGTVFVALLSLVYVLEIMNRVINRKKAEKKPFPTKQIKEIPVSKAEPEIQKEVSAEVTEDEEIAAVIAAAIATVLDQPVHNFVVKSIRRITPNAPSWNRAGRQEQIMNHL